MAGTQDLGKGFRFHGVATPMSNPRGIVATVDGEGRDVVLVWLHDHRGGYAILVIDAVTGAAREVPMPFDYRGDAPFASILSRRNRFYTHFVDYFVEFDPASCTFTFCGKTATRMAMSMTEDDRGRIWAATYPSSGVVCFDPETRELRDYGHLYAQNWAQYPRCVATDDAGWLYFGVGFTSSQIIAMDPESGSAAPILGEEEREKGLALVERDANGRVYGLANEKTAGDLGRGWIELYRGEARRVGARGSREPVRSITGSQSLFHATFPDGEVLETCDLTERRLVVKARNGKPRKLTFDYSSDGAHVMALAVAPDRTVSGGTAFPMRRFSYDPGKDAWTSCDCSGHQWNAVTTRGDRFYVGAYCGGFLLEWDPSRPWVAPEKGSTASNPRLHFECEPVINRPHKVFAHSDGRTLVLAGTPGYGHTGGGLLFWDRPTGTHTLVRHTELLPEQSTMSLVELPGGELLGGSTTAAGTGGAKRAAEAELYLLDLASRRITWHAPALPGAQAYIDLYRLPDGLVMGIADKTRFFVFDPRRRAVVHEHDTATAVGPSIAPQGPRVFIGRPDGSVYALFVKGIARIEPGSWEITLLAESPVPIQTGGDILDGRIYFASGSHVYSWDTGGR